MTTDQDRFAKRVHPAPNGCHLWTGAIDEDGYGTFNVNGTKVAAHIYAFGDVPDGHELDHLCHNADLACPGDATCLHRRCVNRAHLDAVTHTVNLQRRHERARQQQEQQHNGTQFADSVTTEPKPKRVVGRPFTRGDARINTAGRPKKGESLLDYTLKLVEKPRNKQLAAEAHLERLLRRDAVGARTWSDHRDTYHGLPKQTLVLEQGDSPLASLLERMASRTSVIVEGESRLLSDITPTADAQSET